MNAAGDGYHYSISYYLLAYNIVGSSSGKQKNKAYAYEITVTRSWDNTEEVYEDIFDSYTMDLSTFKAQLNARLSEYNDNEQGYTYRLGSDAKNYSQKQQKAKSQKVQWGVRFAFLTL